MSNDEIKKLIIEECDNIKMLLLDKNEKYGNSALFPKRIFSKANAIEQIKVRIDDKLSRIINLNQNDYGDLEESQLDSAKDLIGYLILMRVAEKIHNS